MDSSFSRLARTDDSIHTSQELLLSENEFLMIQKELPGSMLDDMGLFTEDSKSCIIKHDTTILDPYIGPLPVPYKSPTCALPCTEDWSGPYNFELFVNSVSSSKKTWLFSYILNKVFIDVSKSIPLQFKIDFPTEDEQLFVRALPIYTVAQHMSYPVNRCPLHLREDENKGITNIHHVVRCEDQCSSYEYDDESKRYSVVVPLGHPQAGSDVITLMYSLVCKSSCCGGMNRRPIMIIFTLEKNQQVIGRKTLNIRVCSCPKRDKEKEERSALEEKVGQDIGAGKKLMDPKDQELLRSIPPSKKRKLFSSTEENSGPQQVYNVKLYGAANCTEILRYLIMLKGAEYSESGSEEALRIKQEYCDMLKKVAKNEAH